MTNKNESILDNLLNYLEYCSFYYDNQEPTTVEDIYTLTKLFYLFFDRYPDCFITYFISDKNDRLVQQNIKINFKDISREGVIDLIISIKKLDNFKFFMLSKECKDVMSYDSMF